MNNLLPTLPLSKLLVSAIDSVKKILISQNEYNLTGFTTRNAG